MSASADAALALAGERVRLLAERALFWERERTLVAADLHWGKAATFRAAAIPLPPGTTAADLARLDAALDRTGARRLVILGDLFHARAGRASQSTVAALRAWRARRPDLDIVLVRGNHDRHAGDPPPELGITCADAPLRLDPFTLMHHPAVPRAGYGLAGHVHPAVRLVGSGRLSEQLPCFVVGSRLAVLPAFGSFTGSALVEPAPGDRVYVVAGGEVVPVLPRGARAAGPS